MAVGVLVRAWRAAQLDVFEDGYHHWYIAASLARTGVLDDGIGKMTGGGWLPLYYYLAAGAMLVSGSTSIFVLKGLGILCSAVTTAFVFLMGERWRKNAGLIAAFFFALNPLDILQSSMSLPDSLALALLTAALCLLIFHSGSRARLMAAGTLLAAAAATRYEVWAVLPVVFFFVMLEKNKEGLSIHWRAAAFAPSILVCLMWLALNPSGWSLVSAVFGQTALQPPIVAERTGLAGPQRAAMFWVLYGANEAVLLFLAAAFYIGSLKRKEKLPRGLPMLSAIFLLFIILLSILVAAGIVVGSYRYLSYTVVTVALAASLQAERLSRDFPAALRNAALSRRTAPGNTAPSRRTAPGNTAPFGNAALSGWRPAAAAGIVFFLLIPSIQYSLGSAGAVSTLNEPQVRTGLWLRDHVSPGDGPVLVDSPLAAYYSGLPPEMMAGSAVLPANLTRAREMVLGSIGFVVFVDHPNFQLVKAFPELRKGRSVGHFIFEYTPNDWRVAYGALPTYIYKVDRGVWTLPAGGNLSLRFYDGSGPASGLISPLAKGAVLVSGERETVGEGAGFGAPVLNWSGRTYFPSCARNDYFDGGLTRTFLLDMVEVGPFPRTTFVSAPPAGAIRVGYRLDGSVVSIDADLSCVPRNATLMMLNEQGGERYTRYTDFDGNNTVENSSWRRVTAWYNYLLDAGGRGFRVDCTPGFQGATKLYLGRETIPGYLDWSGLDYELELSCIAGADFSYDVHLVEA